MVLGASPKLNM
uniref:Uncharacterized protein n=1 Tax=Arundo donax TaxID=35708 RepID=A0A0A9A7B1_ARUDO